MNSWKGGIIEESLTNNRFLNNFTILNLEITTEEREAERWHIFTVQASEKNITLLASKLRAGPWYADFRKKKARIIVFKGKVYTFLSDDKKRGQEVMQYGRTLGIPRKQLDF